ncbi:MAG: glycoside hydrolase family 3 C-terminal domain-containing protein, partial [Desulfuromonadales bacterium]|nr:glycoside hydrolase family 3 C-terminal domain-containing protein [Desulfuromonadales bacterium]
MREEVSKDTIVDFLPCGGKFDMKKELLQEAAERASKSECAIVVVGENALRYRRSQKKTAGENCDYTTLQLPGNQKQLIQAIQATGTPVVVVLINARPLAVSWCAENVPAILETWEPGLLGGKATAEVIFGKVNPSGRLPISIPRSVGHLQCVYNYTPQRLGRYGDSTAAPLFPFGHGLSYTEFKYSNLKCPKESKAGEPITVTVSVTNAGNRDGREIVLLYTRDMLASVAMPVKELKAFQPVD